MDVTQLSMCFKETLEEENIAVFDLSLLMHYCLHFFHTMRNIIHSPLCDNQLHGPLNGFLNDYQNTDKPLKQIVSSKTLIPVWTLGFTMAFSNNHDFKLENELIMLTVVALLFCVVNSVNRVKTNGNQNQHSACFSLSSQRFIPVPCQDFLWGKTALWTGFRKQFSQQVSVVISPRQVHWLCVFTKISFPKQDSGATGAK